MVANAEPIDEPQGLLELGARLARDVEGDGLYRYRSRLCTLQLACEREAHVIDALAVDLSPLAVLVGESGPEKVVHDLTFDARSLLQRGLRLANVFDTAIAAKLLGETSTGLSTLLERDLGVRLDKRHQQADWGRRPLTGDQLAYLVDDVRHLVELAALFEARVVELDLRDELRAETEHVLARALEPEPAREPWTRIKGANELEPQALGALCALAELRERVAQERDVPPFRVEPNGVLMELARRPSIVRAQRLLRTLDPRDAMDAIAGASPLAIPPPAMPVDPPPHVRRAREKRLAQWRREEAAKRGVSEQAILPGHCLRDLAGLPRLDAAAVASVSGIGRVRVERYAIALVTLLA